MSGETKVQWREWGEAAFAEAKSQNKPVLLGISAVWCHWCHVMDRGIPGDPIHTGVYNNPQIAEFINDHFIPIRVDNDQRPDVNARYNMGGWPTTCFLTPDGDLIYGATYLAPMQMRQLLQRVLQVWRDEREEILKQVQQSDAQRALNAARARQPSVDAAPAVDEVVSAVASAIIRSYDWRNGGLGDGQKFPMSDAWALLLALYARRGEAQLLNMIVQTLIAMGSKGMYDLVAGGWFRYSTTPDWSVPHFEKMLEDHARLLPVYAHAIQLCRRAGRHDDAEALTQIVAHALDYLTTTLLRDEPGLTYFAGSQDADEDYYMLSRAERAQVQPPFIDWRLYADWNALMVSALLQLDIPFERAGYAELAIRTWRTLIERCVGPDGSVVHSLLPRAGDFARGTLSGQLGDQAALTKACLDIVQHQPALAGEALAIARRLTDFAMQALRAPEGGFYDTPADPNAQGMLRVRIQPIFDNCTMAEALTTLRYLTDEPAWEQVAQAALAAFAHEYKRYREHAAPYALAVMRAMELPDEVVIVGQDASVTPFVRAAHAQYAPWRIVRVLHPDHDADVIQRRGYPTARLPVAFVCRGTTCSAPIYEPHQLSQPA
jgi:uncharacterized protein YyaL (SSP411 family)